MTSLSLRPHARTPALVTTHVRYLPSNYRVGERDIYTGDYVDILIITKDGVRQEKMELRFD